MLGRLHILKMLLFFLLLLGTSFWGSGICMSYPLKEHLHPTSMPAQGLRFLFVLIKFFLNVGLTRPLLWLWLLLLQSTASRVHGLNSCSTWASLVATLGLSVTGPGFSCPRACGHLVPTQGSNQHSLHWKADSQPLNHQGSPRNGLKKKSHS